MKRQDFAQKSIKFDTKEKQRLFKHVIKQMMIEEFEIFKYQKQKILQLKFTYFLVYNKEYFNFTWGKLKKIKSKTQKNKIENSEK